ncbi:putative disease resistance protein At4g11170 isoform X2 [Eucalyptus grandis]|uniref:putative disease resistance protein At4g11170 isoform X2 n=1 Tax=Eucalyptus grandis TaxID=71139 RepID=UPI00192EA156|nr:putative disease resistance protein At4g11170 isoform X2 [Eucalyptus grandis]
MEPQKQSRLWIYEEAVDVLVKNKGTSEIQALCLNKYDQRTYSHEQFKELTNLRFLQVNGVNLDGNFWNLLPQLRWLWWERCPSDFAATNFHPEKLVVLDLSWGTISEDWGGWALLKEGGGNSEANIGQLLNMEKQMRLAGHGTGTK